MTGSFVSVQTITKRDLNRNPALLTKLRPGESLTVQDREGGLTVRREKRVTLTPAMIEADLARICAGGPATDALAMMEEEA